MKLTQERFDFIQKVIDENPNVKTRIKALRASKKKFVLKEISLGYRGGKVHELHQYARSSRLQIGSPKGYMRYVWAVIFDPLTTEEVWKFNKQTFGRYM
jgi:hypothetical protein